MTVKEIVNQNKQIEWVTIICNNNALTIYCKNVIYLKDKQLNTKVKHYEIKGNHLSCDNR